MKTMKAILLVVMAVCFMATLSAQNAQAVATWFNGATVLGSGTASGAVLVLLSDNTVSPPIVSQWYVSSPEQSKEVLATALTAMSLGKICWVQVSDTAQFSTILNMYINNQ